MKSREFKRVDVDQSVCGLYKHKHLKYLVYFVDEHHGFTLTDFSMMDDGDLRLRKPNTLYRWAPMETGQWERIDLSKLSIGE